MDQSFPARSVASDRFHFQHDPFLRLRRRPTSFASLCGRPGSMPMSYAPASPAFCCWACFGRRRICWWTVRSGRIQPAVKWKSKCNLGWLRRLLFQLHHAFHHRLRRYHARLEIRPHACHDRRHHRAVLHGGADLTFGVDPFLRPTRHRDECRERAMMATGHGGFLGAPRHERRCGPVIHASASNPNAPVEG